MPCVLTMGGPLLLAVLLDVLLGEPPNRWHPVAWMGRFIETVQRWAPPQGQWGRLLYGAGIVIGGVSLVVVLGVLLERLLWHVPWPVAWLVKALGLKLTMSLRGLVQAADEVRQALAQEDLPRARHLLGWHLVSRDTCQLSDAQVAAAAVESVGENASDGVVAPLLFYTLGGLPAALAYRFINTADAMLGYRDAVVPARLTAALIVLAALIGGENARQAWTVWRRDASLTASPNAGHPMSAMAGALQVELEKVGHYRLGAGQPLPGAQYIARATRLLYGTTALAVVVLAGVMFLWC
jgi:adenosylcobinamide-phosphate synthase